MMRRVRAAGPVALVAAVFVVTVELLRAASPLLDLFAGAHGVVGAAQLAIVIFGAPALVGLLVAAVGTARATLGAGAALVLLRLVAQAQPTPTLLVVGAGAAIGIAALVLVVRQAVTARSGVTATIGVLLGAVVDLTVRAAYGTWDPIFRPGVLPWLVTLAVCGAVVAALLAVRPALTDTSGGLAGALGPYLALYVMGYGSAAFVASQAGVSLPLASAVLIGTAVAGMELVRRMWLPGGSGAVREPDRWFAGTAALLGVAGGVAAAYWLTGPVVLAAVAVAALSAALLLARALTPVLVAPARPSQGFTIAGLAAGFGYVLPVLLYQTHYDLEFPFDNRYALVAAAVLLGLVGLGRRPAPADPDRRGILARPAAMSGLAAVALLVPLGMAVTHPAVPGPDQSGATVRLLSWNVMYGRDHLGGVPDPEAIAAVIEQTAPDVVLLQEVSRGWPIGGGVDLAEWLSRRVGMAYEWAPAADGQFGNAVLTRLPVADVTAMRLPFVQGPMERSYLAVTVELADGRELRLINTHLQHRKGNTETRLAQSEALVAAWGGGPRTVIAGDFNFWPSWPEPQVFLSAGFRSAQDVTGQGAGFTAPTHDPDNRIDWIFGTPDLTFSDFAILDATNSDHFPLVVTVEVPTTRG